MSDVPNFRSGGPKRGDRGVKGRLRTGLTSRDPVATRVSDLAKRPSGRIPNVITLLRDYYFWFTVGLTVSCFVPRDSHFPIPVFVGPPDVPVGLPGPSFHEGLVSENGGL